MDDVAFAEMSLHFGLTSTVGFVFLLFFRGWLHTSVNLHEFTKIRRS